MSKNFHTRVPRLILPTLVAAALALPAAFAAAQPASTPGGDNASQVVPAERFDVSPPLSEMAAGQERREAAPVFREIPRQPLPRRGPKAPGPDPALQDFHGPAAGPAPQANFDGGGNVDAVLPPDTNGAVGKTQYVQWVNLSFAVYDKTTGAKVLGPVNGNTLWQGFGGPCETTNDGDPIVLYDHLADRWFMSQFALPGGSQGYWQCIAVSQTEDAMGAWNRYAFKWSSTKINDYPKFGRWADGYYMAVNQFTCTFFGCSWAGQGVAVFERDKLLAGQPARMIMKDLYGVDPNLGGMLPADLDGSPPPAGTPNYFVQFDDNAWGYSGDQLQLWAFSVNWASGTGSFTFVRALPTAAFDSNLCGYSSACIPQRGTKRKVDAISDRLMYRLQYRTFSDHATMVVNHTVDVNGTDRAGIRWYELRNAGGGWGIHQEGTYAPDANHRWMGSMAIDKDGNIALGYSVSGANLYPAIRYTGRGPSDPLNMMTLVETSIVEGAGSQTHSSGRWGDYSAMAVDPVDDCTFWYTTEYYSATSSAGWKTRIASLKFDSCGTTPPPPPGADLSVGMGDSPDPVTVGGDVTYATTVTNNGFDDATNVVVADTLPATVTFKSASASQGSCNSASPVSCNLGSLTNGQTANVTIVGTTTATGTLTNTASVSATEADPNTANNSASATTTVNAPPPPPGAAPVVDACSPNNGNRNQQLVVAVTGSSFQSGATASFGQRVMVQAVTFVSATQLNVQIKVHPQASSGPRTVTITNPDGQSGTKTACFTVN